MDPLQDSCNLPLTATPYSLSTPCQGALFLPQSAHLMQHSWERSTLACIECHCLLAVCGVFGLEGDRSTCPLPLLLPHMSGNMGARDIYGILYIFCRVLCCTYNTSVCLHVCIFLKCLSLHSYICSGPRQPVQVLTNGSY